MYVVSIKFTQLEGYIWFLSRQEKKCMDFTSNKGEQWNSMFYFGSGKDKKLIQKFWNVMQFNIPSCYFTMVYLFGFWIEIVCSMFIHVVLTSNDASLLAMCLTCKECFAVCISKEFWSWIRKIIWALLNFSNWNLRS